VLERVKEAYAKYDWHVRIHDGTFDADYGAPTAGPPVFNLYVLNPSVVFGFGAEGFWSPTRWRF
jgi:hypothetical protein